MGRMYTVEFENQVFTNALGNYDVFELDPIVDHPIQIHAVIIENVSEIGEAEEEMVRWNVTRGNSVSGNGTSTTPARLSNTDIAADTVAEVVASTIASSGSPRVLHSGTWNIRIGLQWIPIPEIRPRCSNADQRIVVRFLGTFVDDVTLSGTIYFEEF